MFAQPPEATQQTLHPYSMQKQTTSFKIIAEDLHILNPFFQQAVEKKDTKSLTALACQLASTGAHALDVNLGPSRKNLNKLDWVIDTIQNCTDLPLFLSAVALKQPQLLLRQKTRLTVNAVTADPDSLNQDLATCKKYDTNLVVLLVKPGLLGTGIQEKMEIASDVIAKSLEIGFPLERLYLDPILASRQDPFSWEISRGVPDIDPIIESIELLKEASEGAVKTIISLSNATSGLDPENRSAIHCQLLPLLQQAGLDAAIINTKDPRLMASIKK